MSICVLCKNAFCFRYWYKQYGVMSMARRGMAMNEKHFLRFCWVFVWGNKGRFNYNREIRSKQKSSNFWNQAPLSCITPRLLFQHTQNLRDMAKCIMLPVHLKLFHILGFLSKILNCWTKGFLRSFWGQYYFFYNIKNSLVSVVPFIQGYTTIFYRCKC